MKRYAVIGTLMLALAIPATASASSPYNRYCGTRQDGWLVGHFNSNNETPYEVHGPWHIVMTRAEAVRLQRRFPAGEFGSHITLAQTPCFVGQAIASNASMAWVNWTGDSGWANVVADSSGGETRLGRFRCSGYAIDNGNALHEICGMRDRDGHLVVGTFDITKNPYY